MTSKASRVNSARFFTALGHHRRLLICDLLRAHHKTGLRFDRLGQLAQLSASTLSHHLSQMDKGGILVRKSKGRETWFSLDLSKLDAQAH